MDYGRLWAVADRARSGKRLATDDVAFIRDIAPAELESFPRLALPKRFHHPAGFSVSGASVGTFVRAALLLSAQKVFGKRYEDSIFYQSVEKDLAFGVMRSHFHHGYPKGTHCCVQCTLAVYPVLESGGIRYFDCKILAGDVKRLIEIGGWRFANPPSDRMVRWALLGPELKLG
jgi:hypothetical protein